MDPLPWRLGRIASYERSASRQSSYWRRFALGNRNSSQNGIVAAKWALRDATVNVDMGSVPCDRGGAS